MNAYNSRIVLIVALAAVVPGCVALVADTPNVQNELKTVSAGFTGCMPEQNELSNVAVNATSMGTWNATCKGKTYLCTGVDNFQDSRSFQCAPVAQ